MQPLSRSHPLLSLALGTLAVAMSCSAGAQELELSADQVSITGSVDSGAEGAKSQVQTDVYIVRLEDSAVATYMGGVAGLAATANRATGASILNTNSDASVSYANYLKDTQAAFIDDCEAALGHELNVRYTYQHAFNGIAVQLTPAEADELRAAPGVISVTREQVQNLQTDVGPQWIKANQVWNARGWPAQGTRGEGIVVAVFDSGINSAHPSFADIGGDHYDHVNPLGSGNYVPGSYCDVSDPNFCNDKLIGAWDFTPQDTLVPEDEDGHGSHTAGTAAGNVVRRATLVAPTTQLTRNISGVAPHANLVIYDVCTNNSCFGASLLAAINQIVVDAANIPGGIHALNYSISGGGDPYNDTIELGFLAATAAGVYVAASAGNNGPGPSTNGHNGPWVSTTAAMTHNRLIENSVIDMTSDAAPLADIVGAGLTSEFGPAPIINSADLEGAFPGSTLCGLGTIGSFIPPWPPGTFNGEIVACTRGTFGRVEKGANALAAGAGGYILMDNGGGIVGDAHVLPGVHITQADGAVLAAWLAANPNPMGSISGFFLNLDEANGDIMAGFSSRGPNNINVIKPDIGGPGVSILAAEAVGQAPAPEYQFLSGTSMSSPHNAGSGALMSAMYPSWTPYQIRSALMMTANTANTLKEDGATPTDAFDVGAGRIDLGKARKTTLVMNETPQNFLLADPSLGGDPGTLNLASMQNGNCVGTCSWTRTFDNVFGAEGHWRIRTRGPEGLRLSHTPDRWLQLKAGESGSVTVTADTALASPGWNFATLELKEQNSGPRLRLPMAIFASNSSNQDLLNKTVDAAQAAEGEPLNYEISIVNGQLAGQIDLEDTLPAGLSYVAGSASEVVANGTTITPFAHAGGILSWSGTLDQGGLVINPSPAPFGYFSLASLGVAPFGCPSNCDDGAFAINVPAFTYNGQTYTSVILSVNGTIEAGTASGLATSFSNQNLPDPTPPNNLMAPFWTDLNMGVDGDGAEWYVANLTAGPNAYTVYEWENIPRFGSTTDRFTFQVWVQTAGAGAGGIWYVYAQLGSLGDGTIGAENGTGTIGTSYFFDGAGTAPVVGADLRVDLQTGGTATFNFQATVDSCDVGDAIVNRVNVDTAGSSDTAIAVTECVPD